MRIALTHMRCARVGGTETFLNQLAVHLIETGHEVTIVCRSHEGPPHAGVRMVQLRRRVLLASRRILAFAQDVERHLKDHSYDLVVGLGRTWSQDVIRLGGGCHATYLEHAHAHVHVGAKRWLDRLGSKHRTILDIEARALTPGAYRRIVVNSQFVKDDLVRRYDVDQEAIRLIRNAVDLERFHPRHKTEGTALRKELGLDGPGPVLLFLGSGFGRKGLDKVLESFAQLLGRLPTARLLVVGRDSHMKRWRRMAQRLGIADSVLFAGARGDAPICFGAADVYVLPSRYDSFAFTVIEALASGVPVVVSDMIGAAEVVTPEAGTVVPHDASVEQLTEALAAWCTPEARSTAPAAARAAAERHGTADALEDLTRLFEEVVAEKTAE
jgi:UDP-glucose:(heptosyl)LPS alpha-1,3-glucosyltransferase